MGIHTLRVSFLAPIGKLVAVPKGMNAASVCSLIRLHLGIKRYMPLTGLESSSL